MSYDITSIIPFGSGQSYVVRGIEKGNLVKHRIEDYLHRTPKDTRFLEQFEEVFLAVSSGKLERVQKVVQAGFFDFNAYSVGKYGTSLSHHEFDNITIMEMAEKKGHKHIVEYLQNAVFFYISSKKFDCEDEEELSDELSDIFCKTLSTGKKEPKISIIELSKQITSSDIIKKIESLFSEEELLDLIDRAVFYEGDRNPITYIFEEGEEHFIEGVLEEHREKVIQKLLEKFPVEGRHLFIALERAFSIETISQMIEKSTEIEMKLVNTALKRELSYEWVEKMFDKVKIFDCDPWNVIFPTHKNYHRIRESLNDDLDNLCGAKMEITDSDYWKYFAEKSKPYLFWDRTMPLSLLKKFFIYFPLHSLPSLDELIGRMEERMLWQFVDKVKIREMSTLEHILHFGYSEKFVLHVFNLLDDGVIKGDSIVTIAQLRNYPEGVINVLKRKIYYF